ncbi:MAG: hypothetical protein GY769_14655 [bacterium]|nr:hypothetical protein [bacterium]
MPSRYAYIWEYRVRPEAAVEFERAYGSEGVWAELFRRHEGYVRTELHKDLKRPAWYLTIDYWRSKEDCEDFRGCFASDFEALDRECERLTVEERYFGEFSRVGQG